MATSYSNLGGNGYREGIITVTSAVISLNGAAFQLLNGNYANGYFFFASQTLTSSMNIRFQFNIPQNGSQSVVIDEAKWYQSDASANGIWQWQGSNDGVSWTNVGSNFTLGGATVQTITALNGNTTAYSYYQMVGVSGTTTTSPWLQGLDFSISGFAFTPQFPPNMQQPFFTQAPTFPPNQQRPFLTLAETLDEKRTQSISFGYGVSNFISFSGNPVPVAQVLKGATQGVVYSETISAQSGTPPYTFAVSIGTLPTGLSLNSLTGVISGTPTVTGTSNFTIQVTDSLTATGTQPFTITVAAPAASNYGYFN